MFLCSFQVEKGRVLDLACFAHNINTFFFVFSSLVFQQQLAKNIKFGQPPQMTISVRTMGEANTSIEEDVLLSSPMETETQQDTVISDSGNKVSTFKWTYSWHYSSTKPVKFTGV